MAQLVTRIDDDLAATIDELVAEGVVASRSDAVRRGLDVLIDQTRRRRIADAIVEGYRNHPQRDDDMTWTDDATITMIAEEPW